MKNLLITTIGKYNHFSAWIDGDRDYDIAVVIYDGSDLPKVTDTTCLVIERFSTFKFAGIKKLFEMHPTLSDYEYYWMPDEDVWATPDMINEIFACMEGFNLWCAQPSILEAEDSFPSWGVFKHKAENTDLIHTNFVEVTCPCFSREALQKSISIFPRSKSGWGLDLAWSKLGSKKRMGILNSVAVKHTRPVKGGELYDALTKQGISPSKERKRLMKEFGIESINIKTWI